MKIRQKLISSPSSMIGLICMLVGIICLNGYLNNYRHQLTLRQLSISIALLQSTQAKPGEETNTTRAISDKLWQLKLIEKNTRRLNYFNQLASIAILIGSLLLGVVFFHNVNNFVHKLNRLSMEVKQISQANLDECRLAYPLTGEPDNEIDGLASALEQMLRSFKQSIREKNGMLGLLQQANRDLKLKLKEKGIYYTPS